jgi:hypothetical protein
MIGETSILKSAAGKISIGTDFVKQLSVGETVVVALVCQMGE